MTELEKFRQIVREELDRRMPVPPPFQPFIVPQQYPPYAPTYPYPNYPNYPNGTFIWCNT